MHHLEPGTTLNAGNFFGPTGQLAWLENDLKRVTTPECRVKVPWIVAAGHRPFFGITVKPQLEIAGQPIIKPSGNCDACRAAFLPPFDQCKVDFYLSGQSQRLQNTENLNVVFEHDYIRNDKILMRVLSL